MFRKHVESIERKARAAGLNWTEVCKRAGVSRATPDRWRIAPPKSVSLMDQLETVVDEELRKQGVEVRTVD